jgi:hypothetical protein
MVSIHQQQFQSIRSSGDNLPNLYSSVSDQVTQLIDNYPAISNSIKYIRGGYMYDDDHGPPPGPFKSDEIKENNVLKSRNAEANEWNNSQRGLHINIITDETQYTMISTSVVVASGIPFHPVTNFIKYGCPIVQLTQHRSYKTGCLNPYYISKYSNGQFRTIFEFDDQRKRNAAEVIEFAIIALLQATVALNLQVTVYVPKSFYDRHGNE